VTGLGNLQFYRHAQTGNFAVFGALGDDATAHSKHLQNIGQFLDDLPLSQVPEPTAAATILLAATGTALIRRSPRGRRNDPRRSQPVLHV
jgi:hypothetical protein